MNSGNCCETSSLVNGLTGTILIMITTLQFTKTAYNLYPAKYRLFIDDPMPMGASVSLFDCPTQKKTNRVYSVNGERKKDCFLSHMICVQHACVLLTNHTIFACCYKVSLHVLFDVVLFDKCW